MRYRQRKKRYRYRERERAPEEQTSKKAKTHRRSCSREGMLEVLPLSASLLVRLSLSLVLLVLISFF